MDYMRFYNLVGFLRLYKSILQGINLYSLYSLKLLIFEGFGVLSHCTPVIKLFNLFNLAHLIDFKGIFC